MRYIFQFSVLLTLIMLMLFSSLLALGFWQLNRAAQKTLIQQQYNRRAHEQIELHQLNNPSADLRFYKLKLTGKFDNQHGILLDNKIINHQIGYELYMPFYLTNTNKILLVDRGFIPQGPSRQKLPAIKPESEKKQLIEGILNTPPASGILLGSEEALQHQWPIRVSHIDLSQLGKLLHQEFYHYILIQNTQNIVITSMTPERHKAYAVQWFLLAGISGILYIILSLKPKM